jgi:hypothetical protein
MESNSKTLKISDKDKNVVSEDGFLKKMVLFTPVLSALFMILVLFRA